MLAAATEPLTPNRFDTLGRLLLILIAIIGAILLYYYFLFERGSEHVYRRNFRTLAQIERQINSGLERIRVVATNHKFKKPEGSKSAPPPPLVVAGTTYPTKLFSQTTSVKDTCHVPANTAMPPMQQRMLYDLVPHGDGAQLTLCVWPGRNFTQLNSTTGPQVKPTTKQEIIQISAVPLANLINWRNVLEQFHQVLIFDSNRKLILRSSDDRQFTDEADLHDLLTNQTTTHEAIIKLPEAWSIEEKREKEKSKTKDDKTGGNLANPSAPEISKVQSFTIGNQEYLAFIRPVRISAATLDEPGESPVWYVVGITTEAEFNNSRFLLPRWWVTIVIFALLLFALVMPYIKLRLLGPNDLIRSTNVAAAIFGLILAMPLAATIILNFTAHHLAENTAISRLPKLGEKIADSFNSRYEEAKVALDYAINKGPSRSDIFSLTAIIDQQGDMCAVEQDGDITFDAISVVERKYWSHFEKYKRIPADDTSDLTYALEVLETYIDGKRQTVIAKRLKNLPASRSIYSGDSLKKSCPEKPTDKETPYIFSGIFSYPALDSAIFAKGYGFIIIDNQSGIVQYHSEENENLIERLYEETDNNPILKAAVNAHETATFNTSYRGHSYLFHARPLAYPNWTLLTYFNREQLDNVNLGLIFTAIGLSFTYIALATGFIFLCFRLLSISRINHLWPNPRRLVAYRELLLVLTCLAAAEAAAVYQLHAERLMLTLIAAPLLAISISYICLVRRYQPFDHLEDGATEPRRNLGNTVCALLLIVTGTLAADAVAFIILLESARPSIDLKTLVPRILPGLAIAIAAFGFHIPARTDGSAHTLLQRMQRWWSGRRASLQCATAVSAMLILFSATTSEASPWAAATSIVLIAMLVLMTIRLLARKSKPRLTDSKFFLGIKKLFDKDHQSVRPSERRTGSQLVREIHDLTSSSERRSDRDLPNSLHRWCITLLLMIFVLLPTLAFYRDSTALYVLRWLQQDAQKVRGRLEQVASNPDPVPSDLRSRNYYRDRLLSAIAINTQNGLFNEPVKKTNCKGVGDDVPIMGLFTPTLRKGDFTDPPVTVEQTILAPILKVSNELSSSMVAFNRENAESAGDIAWNQWRRCQEHPDEIISNLPVQHSADFTKLSIQQRWRFNEVGFIDWNIAIGIGVPLFAALVILPIVRRVLRELVPDADMLASPELSQHELKRLINNWRGMLILVSANAVGKYKENDYDAIEKATVKELIEAFPEEKPRIARLYDVLPETMNEEDAPSILVVAEERWPRDALKMWNQKILDAKHPMTDSEDRIEGNKDDEPADEWNLFKALRIQRLTDDCSGLVLSYWLPTQHFTLLVCPSIEAQDTLAAFVTRQNQGTANQWALFQPGQTKPPGNNIWISHLESILQKPFARHRLLEFIERASTQPKNERPSIVITTLVLPHLWMTDAEVWQDVTIPDVGEQTRWLTMLAQANVRSVRRLNIQDTIGEMSLTRHALPRAGREAEYMLWWRYSTRAERMALAGLAHEGLINPHNRSIIRSLMARGLIFRRRTLHFADRGFKRFVRHQMPAIELHRRANQELQYSSWGSARGPLFVILAVVGYTVMATGSGALEAIAGLVASISASVPVLLNLGRLIRRDGSA